MSTRRNWLLAWLGGPVIGIANGVAREATYGKRVGEGAAHQISTATGVAAFAGYFRSLQRRWPLHGREQALGIGGVWLALTVAFEFGFGRGVAKKPWSELLADYDVRRGRTWPLLLLWIALGPEAVRRLSSPR